MAKRKSTSGLREYLEATGMLVMGDPLKVAAAKKAYRAKYKAAWRTRQRKEKTEYTVSLTDAQHTLIKQAAQQHGRSVTRFLVDATVAQIRGHWVSKDILTLNLIRQELALNYQSLKTVFDESIVPYDVGAKLLLQQSILEEQLMSHLNNAVPLTQLITDAIRADPSYIQVIYSLLQSV